MVASTSLRPDSAPDLAPPARFSLLHVAELPGDVRESRHRLLIALLALHVPALLLLGSAAGRPVREAGLLAVPLLAAVLGARFLTPRGLRSVSVVLGLAWSSYATVHLAGGAPEAHLQPLLVIALIALYQDPGLLALGVVAEIAALAVPSALQPDLVYAAGTALRRPWVWTLVHAGALVGVALAAALAWRRDVPVPVFAEPQAIAHPQVALPEPPPAREVVAEHVQRARSAELALAQRQTTYALMTNLARRNQSLIGRQLSTLDELERDERDPDVLAGLFALDHLATRMRRNAENLLVLAGAPASGRGFAQPVPVDELLRGAAAEVEQYARVDVDAGTPTAVAGHVVSDVAHLLAELLDNALACSPPHSRVTVGAAAAADGTLRLWVADEGIGMTAARLAEHNASLARVDDDLEVGATLGFPVVKRLAARHHIRVTLGGRDGGRAGLVAYVDVPAAVVVGLAPVEVPGSALPEPTALPGRRAARRAPTAVDRGRRNELALDAKHEPGADAWFAPTPLPEDSAADDGWGASEPAAELPAPPAPTAPSGLPVRDRRGGSADEPSSVPATPSAAAPPTPSPAEPVLVAGASSAEDVVLGAAPRIPAQPTGIETVDAVPTAPAAPLSTPELSAAVSAWTEPHADATHATNATGAAHAGDATHAAHAAGAVGGVTVLPGATPLAPLTRRVPQQALREAGGPPQTFEPATPVAAAVATAPDPARAQDLLSAYRAGLTRARTVPDGSRTSRDGSGEETA